jgi:N-acetylmuramoyl-L-alanine amidase
MLNLNLSKFFGIILFVFGLLMVTPTQTMPEVKVDKLYTTKVSIDSKQLACLAKNIFHEAGHESILGQAAVARVVINRVNHGFGKNPCEVVYQKTSINDKLICQFSWVCEGKTEPNKNSYRYRVSEQVAYDVMVNGKYKELVPSSTLFFHNTTVNPLWPHQQVAKIGNHVFYAKAKKVKKPKKKE